MTIQIAALCDAATDYSGKLNILGTFDTIFSTQLPAVHPNCSIALRFLFTRLDEGAHQLAIHFVDDDGQDIMPPIPNLPLHVEIPDEVEFLSRNCIVNIQQLRFEHPGQYAIDIALDSTHVASIPLRVTQIPLRHDEDDEEPEPSDRL